MIRLSNGWGRREGNCWSLVHIWLSNIKCSEMLRTGNQISMLQEFFQPENVLLQSSNPGFCRSAFLLCCQNVTMHLRSWCCNHQMVSKIPFSEFQFENFLAPISLD